MHILEKLKTVQLWLISVAFSVVMSLLIVAGMSFLLKKTIEADLLLIGLVTSLIVASIVVAIIANLLGKLKLSNEYFRTLSESIPDQVWTASPDGILNFANNRMIEFFGLSAEAIIGGGWLGHVHPDDLQDTIKRWSESLQSGEPYEMELRLRHHSGAYHWCIARALALRDPRGKIVKWYGTNTDVSEQKRIEQQQAIELRELDVMERISQISLATGNVDDLLKGVLDEVLRAFNADRAWFLYPCDPDAPYWTVPIERTRPGWETNSAHGLQVPMTAEVAAVMREGLEAKDVVEYGPNKPQQVPDSVAEQFLVKSQMQTTLRPSVGRPWMFGLHHCEQACDYDKSDLQLFRAIAQRVSDSLSSLISLQHLRESEEKYRNMFESAPVGLFHSSREGRLLRANPAIAMMLGYDTPEELITSITDLSLQIHSKPEQRQQFIDAMLGQDGWVHIEGDFLRRGGEVIRVNITGRKVAYPNGALAYFEAFVEDITEKKKAEELIWRQANYDLLTGLPNRSMFRERLERELKKSQRANLPLALMFLDLDRFKEVNDSLGHHIGDTLLQEVSHRLSGCVRETDTVARLGGDEFTIILSELYDPESVVRATKCIMQSLAEPFQLGHEVAYASVSIGITFFPSDGTEVEVLLKNADQAMYEAKKQGRNRFCLFTPEMQESMQAKMRLANDMRGALAGNQFWVAYQPIVELATGKIHKAEALLRWHHPTRGVISPAEFIPVAEDTGLIIDIGNWVFQAAARQVLLWRAMFDPSFQISVNKSPVQFIDDGSVHNGWLEQMEEFNLPEQSIVIEITEGLLLNADAIVDKKLLKFRDAGMQVAIDDFGTGYSSLSYLKQFDIDYIKIDQSFVRNLLPDSNDMALCEAIIVMAHKLGMKVIAEGVETALQRDLLMSAGCDYGQGYLFSKPISADQFEKLLERG